MRRFLTLVCLLGLAIPAGVSISGCYRNPAGKYCPETSGYGLLQTQVASITLQPQIAGISLAYGQTTQVQTPAASTCVGTAVSVSSRATPTAPPITSWWISRPPAPSAPARGTATPAAALPITPICNPPSPLPTTGGLPYAVAYITATADSVTSNPVAVYVHPQVTSVSWWARITCLSQGTARRSLTRRPAIGEQRHAV